jgi:hypothetical protein
MNIWIFVVIVIVVLVIVSFLFRMFSLSFHLPSWNIFGLLADKLFVPAGHRIENSYPLVNDHTGLIRDAHIRFSLQFFDAAQDPHWGRGVLDSQNPGIPYCYFPQRKGCRVTLSQDAHMTRV